MIQSLNAVVVIATARPTGDTTENATVRGPVLVLVAFGSGRPTGRSGRDGTLPVDAIGPGDGLVSPAGVGQGLSR